MSLRWRVATGLLFVLAGLLSSCGAGDPTGIDSKGILRVSSGGTGTTFFPATQVRLDFSNSVTVAVRGSKDAATQFTVYTFFGLTKLNLQQVPKAVLVTFVTGLDPAVSSSTVLPSSVVGMVLHTGFDQTKFTTLLDGSQKVLAQDAPTRYSNTQNGTFILEPTANSSGTFVAQDASSRSVRWSVVTLTNVANGEQALLDGGAPYVLSIDPDQTFIGYAGDLGLLVKPTSSGGGPPSPPGVVSGGTTTGGTGSTTGGTTGSTGDSPPAVPL